MEARWYWVWLVQEQQVGLSVSISFPFHSFPVNLFNFHIQRIQNYNLSFDIWCATSLSGHGDVFLVPRENVLPPEKVRNVYISAPSVYVCKRSVNFKVVITFNLELRIKIHFRSLIWTFRGTTYYEINVQLILPLGHC